MGPGQGPASCGARGARARGGSLTASLSSPAGRAALRSWGPQPDSYGRPCGLRLLFLEARPDLCPQPPQ